MKPHWLIESVACVLVSHIACAAGDLSWTFQPTGFRSSSSNFTQTAISMRGNLSWPVVYGIEDNMLNAYSLFSVPNPGQVPIGPGSYWHQIGTNLTQSPISNGSAYLQAASAAPDGFAVSIQTPYDDAFAPDMTVTGSSLGGFQAPSIGARAVKFGADGRPFIANNATVPVELYPDKKVFDVALGKYGEVGAITQMTAGRGQLAFWQRTPLQGHAWSALELDLGPYRDDMQGATIDLTYDSASTPHVIGISSPQYNDAVIASRFDIVSGNWKYAVLDSSGPNSYPAIADVAAAANDAGIVGAAWVKDGTLKYAFLDTNAVSPTWTVTNVTSSTPVGNGLLRTQGVGLAYDKSGLPVISFVEYGNQQIWIAYDPPLMAPVAGDFNHDGSVDAGDLDSWKTAFGATAAADADGDGDSDGADFLAWQRNVTPATAAASNVAIPEPIGFGSAFVALVAVTVASRRASPPQTTYPVSGR